MATQQGSSRAIYAVLARSTVDLDSVTERLVQCITDRDTDTAKEIIKSGQVDLNAYHATALHECVSENNIVIAELLIANGCDMDVRDQAGYTALYKCVVENSLAIAELLIMNGCDINACNEDITALHNCVYEKNIAIAKLLIANGCDINARGDYGESTLDVCVDENNIAIAELLITNGCDLNTYNHGNTVLHQCVYKHCPEIAEMLLANGGDMDARDARGRTALELYDSRDMKTVFRELSYPVVVAVGENWPAVEKLVKEGGDINAISAKIAELLVTNTSDESETDEFGNTVKIDKPQRDALELCDSIRYMKAVLTAHRTPLLIAAGSGNLERIEELVDEGCDINEQSAHGMTAMHAAAKYGRLACAEFLVFSGARLDIANDSGRTALDYPNTRASIQSMEDNRTRRRWALAAATTRVLPVDLRMEIARRAHLLSYAAKR